MERYEGREVSFITDKTFELLQKIKENILFVPTTTRAVEQYRRINLGIGVLPYALTCNGGVLLVDGKEEIQWYHESLQLIDESKYELKKAEKLLESDLRRIFEIRIIQDLFVFTKCDRAYDVVCYLQNELNTSLVDVFHNGVKVYIVPRNLNKGIAVKRFQKYINSDYSIAAGDSEFDISMLQAADFGIAPKKLAKQHILPIKTICMPENNVYSEEILEYILTSGILHSFPKASTSSHISIGREETHPNQAE